MLEDEKNIIEEIVEEDEIEKEEIVIDLLNPLVIKLESQEDERHSKVSIEPFERGFGYTLGNALRRVLLSSLPGYAITEAQICLLYTSPSPRDLSTSRMPSSA